MSNLHSAGFIHFRNASKRLKIQKMLLRKIWKELLNRVARNLDNRKNLEMSENLNCLYKVREWSGRWNIFLNVQFLLISGKLDETVLQITVDKKMLLKKRTTKRYRQCDCKIEDKSQNKNLILEKIIYEKSQIKLVMIG